MCIGQCWGWWGYKFRLVLQRHQDSTTPKGDEGQFALCWPFRLYVCALPHPRSPFYNFYLSTFVYILFIVFICLFISVHENFFFLLEKAEMTPDNYFFLSLLSPFFIISSYIPLYLILELRRIDYIKRYKKNHQIFTLSSIHKFKSSFQNNWSMFQS